MKKTTKTLMAFLTAMTITAGAMGVTAYAEETNDAAVSEQSVACENPELEQVLKEKGDAMIKYLLEKGIDEENAEDVTAYYVQGLKARIESGKLAADGNENEQTLYYYQNACFALADLQMKRALNTGDPNIENPDFDVEHWKEQIALGLVTKEDGPRQGGRTLVREILEGDNGVIHGDIEYHHDPETNGLFIDGNGVLTMQDYSNIRASFYAGGHIIIGKDVKFEPEVDKEYIFTVCCLTQNNLNDTYIYRGSAADVEFQRMMEYFKAKGDYKAIKRHAVSYIDDLDPYAILDGSAGIKPEFLKLDDYFAWVDSQIEAEKTSENTEAEQDVTAPTETAQTEAKTTNSTLKGDADLDGSVGLSDVTKVSKNVVNSTLYPLQNETAEANADMNGDGVVDGLDTSALIEKNLNG